MITQIRTTSVYVTDQDRALDFYVNKLGFEKQPGGPMRIAVYGGGTKGARR